MTEFKRIVERRAELTHLSTYQSSGRSERINPAQTSPVLRSERGPFLYRREYENDLAGFDLPGLGYSQRQLSRRDPTANLVAEEASSVLHLADDDVVRARSVVSKTVRTLSYP